MNPTHIVIDGKVYKSVDEMPADVRARYEQAAASLWQEIPQTSQPSPSASVLTSGMKFIVDGQEYHRLEDLPPEARAKYEQAMAMLDKNQNGMPDFLEGMPGMRVQTPAQPALPSRPASRAPQPVSPTISPDTSSGWTLVLLVGFLLMLCLAVAAGAWYFFLR
ncbi:MAG: hypothetical protein Kow0070_30770 [Anaerolineales bacterium]